MNVIKKHQQSKKLSGNAIIDPMRSHELSVTVLKKPVIKIKNDRYDELVKVLAGRMADANVLCDI
jgi:hypothetical protein